ncbi:hypothetical protein AFUB_067220 [Aspergillus fumigatus A1163]|uniref:Uncharacterized protein n=1 Tax=Aspergillus fumigatus (strain CBS 144.89 / FGSC A1163 / CEA10) TaxID=451804 RepID=B0Y6J9_ASPFC|nr:hypothetical protein AFUB_067220 [Aspergillus fumigatus A1163]
MDDVIMSWVNTTSIAIAEALQDNLAPPVIQREGLICGSVFHNVPMSTLKPSCPCSNSSVHPGVSHGGQIGRSLKPDWPIFSDQVSPRTTDEPWFGEKWSKPWNEPTRPAPKPGRNAHHDLLRQPIADPGTPD